MTDIRNGRPRPESPVEKLFREAATTDWWPELPLVQEHPARAGGQDYRIDFAVPDWHFGIELDGHATHSTTAAIAADRDWFSEHPQASEYHRDLIPGEFPYLYAPGTRVRVGVTSWGRVRQPLGPVISGVAPSGAAPAIAEAPPKLVDALIRNLHEEQSRRQSGGPGRWSS